MTSFATVENLDRAIESPARIKVCDSFISRLRGLMFQRNLGRSDGLLLVGNRDVRLDAGIHMLFVPFDLAVIWIDSGLEVVDKVLARAWHVAYVPARAARFVLELHPSRFGEYEIGHKVNILEA